MIETIWFAKSEVFITWHFTGKRKKSDDFDVEGSVQKRKKTPKQTKNPQFFYVV